MNQRYGSNGRNQAGVALAIVVWFIAGMSLLVAGIVSRASVDTRMAQLHVARAKVSAAGDGAVQLYLADLVGGQIPATSLSNMEAVVYRVGDVDVQVTLVPGAGLINLNTATPLLLSALFTVAGGVDQDEAELLADNVINWRKPLVREGITKSGASRFSNIEDLLRIDGVTRTLLDAVREYVAAGRTVSGGMDWAQAPPQVLAVLEKSNPGKHAMVSNRKARLAQGEGGTRRKSAGSGRGSYRADSVVRYGGRTWLRRHWVVMESGGESSLPWRMVRTEAPRVIAG